MRPVIEDKKRIHKNVNDLLDDFKAQERIAQIKHITDNKNKININTMMNRKLTKDQMILL